jgi:hypothetical protein
MLCVSVCGREQYCSNSCQKLDQKIHKSLCSILTKLTNKLQPYREVIRLIVEIQNTKKGEDTRILEHLQSYAEYQFGKGVAGKYYCERENGDRISNWIVEIEILNKIITVLANFYNQNKLL